MSAPLRVPSISSAAVRYRVDRRGDAYGCECARAGFLKRGEECTHMRIARRTDALLERCAERHGMAIRDAGTAGDADYRPVAMLCRQCLAEVLALAARRVRQHYVDKDVAKAKVAAARQGRKRPGLRGVVVERETNGTYTARLKDVPGIYGAADSEAQARRALWRVLPVHLRAVSRQKKKLKEETI